MGRHSSSPDLRDLLRELEAAGLATLEDRGQKVMIRGPHGTVTIRTGSTRNTGRHLPNMRASLVRVGALPS